MTTCFPSPDARGVEREDWGVFLTNHDQILHQSHDQSRDQGTQSSQSRNQLTRQDWTPLDYDGDYDDDDVVCFSVSPGYQEVRSPAGGWGRTFLGPWRGCLSRGEERGGPHSFRPLSVSGSCRCWADCWRGESCRSRGQRSLCCVAVEAGLNGP